MDRLEDETHNSGQKRRSIYDDGSHSNTTSQIHERG